MMHIYFSSQRHYETRPHQKSSIHQSKTSLRIPDTRTPRAHERFLNYYPHRRSDKFRSLVYGHTCQLLKK